MLWKLDTVEEVPYESYDSHVVRAPNENIARGMCAAIAGDEGEGVWEDKAQSRCVQITGRGDTEIVLSSFNAG